jgi:hypothetical protein
LKLLRSFELIRLGFRGGLATAPVRLKKYLGENSHLHNN